MFQRHHKSSLDRNYTKRYSSFPIYERFVMCRVHLGQHHFQNDWWHDFLSHERRQNIIVDFLFGAARGRAWSKNSVVYTMPSTDQLTYGDWLLISCWFLTGEKKRENPIRNNICQMMVVCIVSDNHQWLHRISFRGLYYADWRHSWTPRSPRFRSDVKTRLACFCPSIL